MRFFAIQSSKKDSSEYCNVYARVRHGGNNKKYAVGIKVLISEWNKYNSGDYTSTDWMDSNNISYAQFDNILSGIKNLLEGEFDPDTASSEIKKIRETNMFVESKKENSFRKEVYLASYIKKYIEDLKNGTRCKHKRSVHVSDNYITTSTMTLQRLEKFEIEYGRTILRGIDMRFRNDFIAWLKKNNYSEYTIVTTISFVRTIMSKAVAEGLTSSSVHLMPNFVPSAGDVDNVFLTREQIDQLYNINLSSKKVINRIREVYIQRFNCAGLTNQHLGIILDQINKTRDIFVAGCLTGQRESDYLHYRKDMIVELQNKNFLKVKQVKTQKTVYIPLDKRVELILNKYNGEFPLLSKASLNRYIHVICEVIGWTWVPNFENPNKCLKSGNRFCDLVSSHTARRSFATNAYMAGVPLASIMSVTGHAREDGLRRYLKLGINDKAILAEHDMKGFLETEQ